MALRIRKDGRILCAAMHPEEPGDTYLDDTITYKLVSEFGVIMTEPMSSTKGREVDTDSTASGGGLIKSRTMCL